MSLSLTEELELQVIALRGNELAHCAGLVQQAIAALKAQPSGVVIAEHLRNAHAFIENTEAFGAAASHGILECGGARWDIDASKAALAEVARLNSSPAIAGEIPFAGFDPNFCPGSNPENPQEPDEDEARHDAVKALHDVMQVVSCASLYSLAEAVLDAGYVKPVSAGGLDERAAFEAAWAKHYKVTLPEFHPSKHRAGESYNPEYSPFIGTAWWAWRQARAASAPSHGEQVREGWQLVPVDPTPGMLEAARLAPMPAVYLDSMSAMADLSTKTKYRAMLAAAPSAGSQKEQGE